MHKKFFLFKQSWIARQFQRGISFPAPFQESFIFKALVEQFAKIRLKNVSAEKMFSWSRGLLIILPFCTVFLPRIHITAIAFASVDLRSEDFLIPVLLVFVLKILSSGRKWAEIASVESAFLLFLIVAEISILCGMFNRTIDKPVLSLFYLLKWFEYFLVFFITTQIANHEKNAKLCVQVFFLLGVTVACYGYYEHFFPYTKAIYPNYYRLFERAPFHGDANHIGGFFVLWLGFFSAFFAKVEKRFWGILFLISILFVFFPFIWTYSRKSYFALASAMIFSFSFMKERKRLFSLILLFIILGLLLPTRLSERLLDLPDAITSPDPFHSSWAGNWVMWKDALWNIDKFFLLGSGLGSRHRLYYESQHVLILAETGIVGIMAFGFLCLTLLGEIFSRWPKSEKKIDQGMAAGWLIGFTGLLIHSASCVSWTVAKVAVPFWFLTGFVFSYLKNNVRRPDGS